jgi:putative Mn2+ efflux pump MntP
MILEPVLLSLALCADCFAVSLCCSVTIKKIKWKNACVIASAFAIIQSGMLAVGWGLGDILLGVVGKAANIIAFALLLYVSTSLIYEAFSKKVEMRELNSVKKVLIAGIATSIDAAAVGAAKSMENVSGEFLPLFITLFILTALSVCLGILGGSALGGKYGKTAKLFGGLVLLLIAFWKLFR